MFSGKKLFLAILSAASFCADFLSFHCLQWLLCLYILRCHYVIVHCVLVSSLYILLSSHTGGVFLILCAEFFLLLYTWHQVNVQTFFQEPFMICVHKHVNVTEIAAEHVCCSDGTMSLFLLYQLYFGSNQQTGCNKQQNIYAYVFFYCSLSISPILLVIV